MRTDLRPLMLVAALLVLSACVGMVSAERNSRELSALQQAWDAFNNYDYRAADRLFRKALDRSRDEGGRAEALYGRGVSSQLKRPVTFFTTAAARDSFQEIIADYEESELRPLALFSLARLYDLQGVKSPEEDLKQARLLYGRCVEQYPVHPIAHEAALRYAETYTDTLNREQVKKGIAILDDWLAEHPDNVLKGLMSLAISDAYLYGLEDHANSQKYYVQYVENGVYNSRKRGDAYWRIAFIAHHKTDDPELAKKYYKKILDELSLDIRAQRAIDALKELGEDTTGYEQALDGPE